MRILAVVEDRLVAPLRESVGGSIRFCDVWADALPARLKDFDAVIVSGCVIENMPDPLAIWAVSSQIHFFKKTAIYIDPSEKTEKVVGELYPQIKLVTYQGNQEHLMLELGSVAPELFFFAADDSSHEHVSRPRFADSAPGNHNTQRLTRVDSDSGRMRSIDREMSLNNTQRLSRLEASRPGRDISEFEFADTSGIPGAADVLGMFDSSVGNKARPGRDDISAMGRRRLMVDGSRKFTSDPNENSRLTADEIVLKRSVRDVMLGNIEFGKLARVISLIMHLGLTGILEMMNSARCVKLEFRQGKPFITCAESLLAGALCWAGGEYNFNTSQIHAANAQAVDMHKLIAKAINEQYPLNSVLRALEKEFNSVIMRTNCFDASMHPSDLDKWWERCDGKCKLSEIMMSAGAAMDQISRDIYRAWLTDEICFLEAETTKQVRIEFDSAKLRANSSEVAKPGSSSLGRSSRGDTDSSHLDAIRQDLVQTREKFDTLDGYGILGLKPGCGIKALDEAYYAWINKYHADRYVRFNEPAFIKMANELLMLMNAAYSKLSKRERQGGASISSASHEAVQRSHSSGEMPVVAEVSSRIGAGRNRVNTIHSFEGSTGNEEFDNLSKELKNMQFCENKSLKRPKDRQRARIRPASVAVDVDKEELMDEQKSQASVKRMSDILKSRGRASSEESDTVQEESQPSSPNLPKAPWIPANTTPEQQFATAKKKLTLGLAHEAYVSLEWALEKDPENMNYQAYHAYAGFLVNPDSRDDALAKIRDIYEKMKAELGNGQVDADGRARLFAVLYFIGKIELAAEHYTEAKDMLQLALKYNPNDVDAQRSLRYVAMQLDKQPSAEEDKSKGGLMSVIKRLGSIKL
ncbi:MAG: J domain-containing protein [Proteobacteria bacterium]|nr:J domain-containing protein [Pseudomonadota bacterium]